LRLRLNMKIKPEPARKIIKRLEKNGFVFLHQKGSHRYYLKKKSNQQYLTTVPMHPKDLPIGTIGAIIRQSGLKREEFYCQ
jgi:predicted RNA binding protein YcfA (HicA-like mRNA interferase family)